jgi:hypothetical protein
MDPMTFLSRRFETKLEGPIKFGDEVIDEYGIKAVVVRDPYPLGSDMDIFTTLYYGSHLASTRIRDLKKTGKSYAKELNTIFEGLKGIKYD